MSDVTENKKNNLAQSNDGAEANALKPIIKYEDIFPTNAEIDSWATRLGALAILSFIEVRLSSYSGYYQAALVYAGALLTAFALVPMLQHLWRFISKDHIGVGQTILYAIGCLASVVFIMATLVVSAFLVNHLYLNSTLPGWLP